MNDPKNLDRDQQILSRLAKIEHKVDSIEQTSAFALRAEADKHFASVKEIFRRSKRKAQVYLAANGVRSVKEIARHLGIKAYQHVSRALADLHREGLLEIVDSSGGSNIWGKKPLDKSLRVTPFLMREYGMTKDGKPVGRGAKKKAATGRRGKR